MRLALYSSQGVRSITRDNRCEQAADVAGLGPAGPAPEERRRSGKRITSLG